MLAEELVKAFYLGTEAWHFLAQVGEFVHLCLAVASAGGVHAFFYASLFYEFFFESLQVAVEHGVGHIAEREGYVCHLFAVPLREVGLIVFEAVVVATEGLHLTEALMDLCPDGHVSRDEEVAVVFAQFL